MKKTKQKQVSQSRYEILIARCDQFTANVKNLDVEPIKVFDPLPPNALAELELIREVSRALQAKKVEDIRKQKAAEQEREKASEEEKTTEEAKEQSEEEKKEDK